MQNVEYYLEKCEGYIGRCPEIPESLGKGLIKLVEAKLVKDKPKPKKPKSDGSEGDKLASE